MAICRRRVVFRADLLRNVGTLYESQPATFDINRARREFTAINIALTWSQLRRCLGMIDRMKSPPS
jgi:hypothetical protein